MSNTNSHHSPAVPQFFMSRQVFPHLALSRRFLEDILRKRNSRTVIFSLKEVRFGKLVEAEGSVERGCGSLLALLWLPSSFFISFLFLLPPTSPLFSLILFFFLLLHQLHFLILSFLLYHAFLKGKTMLLF